MKFVFYFSLAYAFVTVVVYMAFTPGKSGATIKVRYAQRNSFHVQNLIVPIHLNIFHNRISHECVSSAVNHQVLLILHILYSVVLNFPYS